MKTAQTKCVSKRRRKVADLSCDISWLKRLHHAAVRDVSHLLPSGIMDWDWDRFTQEDLCIGLPIVARSLDKALATGEKHPLYFSNSIEEEVSDAVKVFGKLLLQYLVEDLSNEDGDIAVVTQLGRRVGATRQVLYLFSKLRSGDGRVSFPDLTSWEERVSRPPSLNPLGLIARTNVVRAVLHHILYGCNVYDVKPKHGPGAVADGEKPWEKGTKAPRCWSTNWAFGPEFFMPMSEAMEFYLGEGEQEDFTPHARLVAVPKDFRGPRLISAEPWETQWIQQGQSRSIMRHLESCDLTRGLVNFTDQSVNANLAMTASSDQGFATLDMKDASDHVKLFHLDVLFPETFASLIRCSRSVGVVAPQGPVELESVSPMGSAVCFPLESCLHFAMLVSAIAEIQYGDNALRVVSDRSKLKKLIRRHPVYVYGDDLIVESCFARPVMQYLQDLGLVPNLAKCCVGPRFRESCGCDAFAGVNVTPVRIKLLPRSFDLLCWSAAKDQIDLMLARGFGHLAFCLNEAVSAVYGRPFQVVAEPHIPMGVFDAAGVWDVTEVVNPPLRWNNGLQRTELLQDCVKPVHITLKRRSRRAYVDAILGNTCRTTTLSDGRSGVTSRDTTTSDIELWALQRRLQKRRCWVPLTRAWVGQATGVFS